MQVLKCSVLVALGFVLTASICQAANLIGFLTYAPGNGSDDAKATAIAFSDIYWQSIDGGSITDLSGSTTSFKSAAVTKFVYLDEGYWRSMNSNSSYEPFRRGILDREVVIPTERADIATDKDIRPFVIGSQILGSIIEVAPGFTAILTPLKAELDREVTHYQSGDRKVNNHWIGGRDYLAQATPPASTGEMDITTLDGKTYKNVTHIKFDAETISFIYQDGGAKVYLALLPPDLQKRFNYDPKAIEQQKLAEDKANSDAEAASQNAVIALQTVVDTDIRNFARSASTSPLLSGQVFIALKDGDNVKLGVIHIFLYAKSQMELVITPKKQEAAQQLASIAPQLKADKQKYMEADAASANGQTIVENGIYIDPEKRKANLLAEIGRLRKAGEVYLSPDYYFSDLPTPLAETKTDSDGKFTFSVPPGEYVLVAKGSRNVLAGTEHYWWMVSFNMGDIARSIQLSNDNLSSSDSDDSLISTQ